MRFLSREEIRRGRAAAALAEMMVRLLFAAIILAGAVGLVEMVEPPGPPAVVDTEGLWNAAHERAIAAQREE